VMVGLVVCYQQAAGRFHYLIELSSGSRDNPSVVGQFENHQGTAAPSCQNGRPFPRWQLTEPADSMQTLNGLRLYFETHGEGLPLALCMEASVRSRCSTHLLRFSQAAGKWIVPELQGHGRTADIDRPLKPEFMADDIAVWQGT